VRDAEGRLLEVEGIIIDITERKAAEEKIALLARTDGLTGLANRSTMIERLHQSFAAAQRGALPFAVFYLDLDHFKRINDTLGHPIGDLLLQEVSQRIRDCTREGDLVARLGGDEFAILQAEMSDPSICGALAAKIRNALVEPYSLDGNEVRISVSIGISTYATDSDSADTLLVQADMALYRSKEKGRNQYHFHSDEINQEVSERVAIANDLKEAISQNQLELHYLPEVDLTSGRILGMEALVRWNHPTRGLLGADVFIPAAEKTGTIVALGHWVLDRACQQMRQWRDEGMAPTVIAINLSLAQLKSGTELLKDVIETTSRWDLSPSDLQFDVTEATLAQTKWTQNDVLPRLRALGVRIAIDDFGTDYSSFDYLKTYRVNNLKLAQSFINHATEDADSATTLKAIINFAREVGIGIIAEGVETLEQRSSLISTGSPMTAQGYYFSKAVDSQQAALLLQRGTLTPQALSEPERSR